MKKTFAIILGILMVVFLYVVAGLYFINQPFGDKLRSLFFWLPYLIFFALSIVLVFFTFKKQVKGKLKTFLLLTGISPLVMIVSIILHNLIFGLFIIFFGENFWERIGIGDEPLFFLLAVVVCPIAFLVGLVGSIVLLIKKK
ncbi:MAG: hypothetical protein FJZ05_00490 [Candidatus Nealsonbacteria bacterium]|nr:hypothetical protein [Candidatus Nealsonbacteria bacterium]